MSANGTGALNMLAVAAWDGSFGELGLIENGSPEDNIQKLKLLLVEARKTIFNLSSELVSVRDESFGKCMIGKIHPLSTEDLVAHSNVSSYVGREVWPTHKWLPRGWQKYRTDKDSVAQMILKCVQCPQLIHPSHYWVIVVKPAINKKIISLRANSDEKARKIVIRKMIHT
jgi:hypothetical protein